MLDVLERKAQGWEIHAKAEQEQVQSLQVDPPEGTVKSAPSPLEALGKLQQGLKKIKGVDPPTPQRRPTSTRQNMTLLGSRIHRRIVQVARPNRVFD